MRINNIEKNRNFKGLTGLAKPLGMFYNANNPLPTLFIETGVTLGRTFEANKTGGKIEATERFIEQGTSAIIWLWGVQALKKIGENIGHKVLKLKDLNFDVGFDYLRNPLENVDKKLLSFKTGNILLSTALATGFIGFGLPKINHFITNKILAKNKKNNQTTLKPMDIKDFQKSTKNKNNLAFTSLLDKSLNLAHILENNSTARLFITDFGVIGGRFLNARNKYEKIENLFRDISSIYFYLFSTKHIVGALNKLTGNTNINPDVLKTTAKMLTSKAKENNITPQELINNAFGEISKENQEKINQLFKDEKVIDLKAFTEIFGKSEKAQRISELQPLLSNKSVLTKEEAKSILSTGWLDDAEFLHNLYNSATKGNYNKKNKFVSAKFLDKTRESAENFVKQLAKTLEKSGENLSEDIIKKTANKNIFKNLAFYSIGTVLSTFALAILIPKVQYFIRKKLTNGTEFVGIKEFKENKKDN